MAFVDYRLGHTSGKPHDRDDQLAVVKGALQLLESVEKPGRIADLGRVWSDDDSWKARPLSSGSDGDGRTARRPQPVYQCDADRRLAEAHHSAAALPCVSCIGLDGHP